MNLPKLLYTFIVFHFAVASVAFAAKVSQHFNEVARCYELPKGQTAPKNIEPSKLSSIRNSKREHLPHQVVIVQLETQAYDQLVPDKKGPLLASHQEFKFPAQFTFLHYDQGIESRNPLSGDLDTFVESFSHEAILTPLNSVKVGFGDRQDVDVSHFRMKVAYSVLPRTVEKEDDVGAQRIEFEFDTDTHQGVLKEHTLKLSKAEKTKKEDLAKKVAALDNEERAAAGEPKLGEADAKVTVSDTGTVETSFACFNAELWD